MQKDHSTCIYYKTSRRFLYNFSPIFVHFRIKQTRIFNQIMFENFEQVSKNNSKRSAEVELTKMIKTTERKQDQKDL